MFSLEPLLQPHPLPAPWPPNGDFCCHLVRVRSGGPWPVLQHAGCAWTAPAAQQTGKSWGGGAQIGGGEGVAEGGRVQKGVMKRGMAGGGDEALKSRVEGGGAEGGGAEGGGAQEQ